MSNNSVSPAAGDPLLELGEADAGRTVELALGQTLLINLTGSPTTGYNWEKVPQDPVLLKPLGAPQVKPDSERLGAPARVALRFQAIERGQTSLRLVYRRSWERDTAASRSYEVMVVVK